MKFYTEFSHIYFIIYRLSGIPNRIADFTMKIFIICLFLCRITSG